MPRRFPARRVLSCCLTACLGTVGVPFATAWAAPGDPTAAPAAASDAPTAAILPITVVGELPEADRNQLTQELVEGLRRGAFGVVEPTDVAAASPAANNCSAADCAKKVAGAVSATHVVRTVVTVVDRDYEVNVTLLDGATGQTVANTKDNCEICGVADAGTMLSTAAATLKNKLDALAQGPSTLGVTSDPIGSEIRLDGELVGTTPFEGPVIAGKHVLRVSKDGFITVEREVTFVEGVAETLSFELEKVPSRLPSRPYGYVSIALGVVSLGAAGFFAVLDDRSLKAGGRCEGTNDDGEPRIDDRANCEQVWDTEPIVVSTAVAGAALVTLGVAILLNSAGRKRAQREGGTTARVRHRQRRPRVGVGLGSVSLRGRF